ncbi:hypothetical protein [Kribbella sp. NBC_00359]|uniref:hypothetical protein n=1 Tax=Kribbella sp. NBC_00359 TaxID=2975966 RepID=UPI002E1B1994
MTSLATDAPWWGSPIVAGVFAFVGVLLAQGVGLYSARRAERMSDQRRWHDDRRRLYADFLGAVREIEVAASAPQFIDRKEHADLLGTCEKSYNEIELLGAGKTVQLVADLYYDAMALWANTEMMADADVEAVQLQQEQRNVVRDGRIRLLDEMRVELGIVKAPTGSTVLMASQPFEILQEAAKAALAVQKGPAKGIIPEIAAVLVIMIKQIAVIFAEPFREILMASKDAARVLWRRP